MSFVLMDVPEPITDSSKSFKTIRGFRQVLIRDEQAALATSAMLYPEATFGRVIPDLDAVCARVLRLPRHRRSLA